MRNLSRIGCLFVLALSLAVALAAQMQLPPAGDAWWKSEAGKAFIASYRLFFIRECTAEPAAAKILGIDCEAAQHAQDHVQFPMHYGPTHAAGGCDNALWDHVYHKDRLEVHSICTAVTGTIVDATHGKKKDGCRHEADADGHCFLKLDAGQEQFLNQKNLDNEDGALVFEPMCRYRVTQKDAMAVCKNWKQHLIIPPIGSHVRMTGSFVTDLQHGHNEIHPVSSIEVIP